MILLSAQHIQKSFGGNTVLRDASLVLQDGQRLDFFDHSSNFLTSHC